MLLQVWDRKPQRSIRGAENASGELEGGGECEGASGFARGEGGAVSRSDLHSGASEG